MAEDKKEDKTLRLSKEELEAYVEKSVKNMQRELNKHRGSGNYRRSNPYENMIDHFGLEPEKLIAEYERIERKESNQPSGIRAAIREVVGKAIASLIRDKVNPPKPAEQPEGVKTVTRDQLKDLPENAHLHIQMPEVPKTPVMLSDTSRSKKGRKKV